MLVSLAACHARQNETDPSPAPLIPAQARASILVLARITDKVALALARISSRSVLDLYSARN
jgi:hypothetical protein